MSTSPQQAQRYVVISVLGLLVIAAYRGKLSDSQESVWKRLWGTGVLAIMLGLLADVAPTIAGPFAILTLVGSLTQGGDKAIGNFLGKLGGSGGAAPATPSNQPPAKDLTGLITLPKHKTNKPPRVPSGPTG